MMRLRIHQSSYYEKKVAIFCVTLHLGNLFDLKKFNFRYRYTKEAVCILDYNRHTQMFQVTNDHVPAIMITR
jgi:hypothetical protein